MAEIVEFEAVHEYNVFKTGIVVDVILRSGAYVVDLDARIDTGSTYFIFERQYGERLGLKIEDGLLVDMGNRYRFLPRLRA